MLHVCRYYMRMGSHGGQEGVGSSEAGITGSCKLSDGCWESPLPLPSVSLLRTCMYPALLKTCPSPLGKPLGCRSHRWRSWVSALCSLVHLLPSQSLRFSCLLVNNGTVSRVLGVCSIALGYPGPFRTLCGVLTGRPASVGS